MKYIQTTTADEPNQPPTPPTDRIDKRKDLPIWIIMALGVVFIALMCFYYGKLQGRSEAETEQALKQEQKETQSEIKALDEQNKAKATEVRNESQKAVKEAKIILDNAFVPMPPFKPTNQDTMLQFIKNARP